MSLQASGDENKVSMKANLLATQACGRSKSFSIVMRLRGDVQLSNGLNVQSQNRQASRGVQ
jgi:hypothetical protein